jgi:hypothetical protein
MRVVSVVVRGRVPGRAGVGEDGVRVTFLRLTALVGG